MDNDLNQDHSIKEDGIQATLIKVLEQQAEIKESIDEIKNMRHVIFGEIKLDTLTLEILLEVSDSTLYRWRAAAPPDNLPHYVRDNGSIYYDFDEVMQALRSGRLCAKGFDRMKAIENMKAYRQDNLTCKGKVVKLNTEI